MQDHELDDESDATSLTPGEHELERALGSLHPAAPSAVNQGRALFDAGVVVGRRSARAWQGVAAVMAVALVSSVLVQRGGTATTGPGLAAQNVGPPRATRAVPQATQVAIALRTTAPAGVAWRDRFSAPMPADQPAYLYLRDKVLRRGADAMRPADAADALWMGDPTGRQLPRPVGPVPG